VQKVLYYNPVIRNIPELKVGADKILFGISWIRLIDWARSLFDIGRKTKIQGFTGQCGSYFKLVEEKDMVGRVAQ
jgi:hypothetical protein